MGSCTDLFFFSSFWSMHLPGANPGGEHRRGNSETPHSGRPASRMRGRAWGVLAAVALLAAAAIVSAVLCADPLSPSALAVRAGGHPEVVYLPGAVRMPSRSLKPAHALVAGAATKTVPPPAV
jgi:hypothetical protein